MRKHLRTKFIALFCIGIFTLSACTNAADKENSAGKIRVTTSFYPLTYLVEKIGTERVDITDLTPPAASAHGIELSPADISGMEKSDLIFYLKTMAPAIDKAVETANLKQAVEIGEYSDLLTQKEIAEFSEELPATQNGSAANSEHSEHDKHNKHNKHDEHSEHANDGDAHAHHQHGIYDPHFWTDPKRLAKAASLVAEKLSAVDPQHKEEYRKNAKNLEAELIKLATDFQEEISGKLCISKAFIVTHLAFGYLAKENNLQQIGIAGFDPEIEPSPARISQIKEAVAKHKLTTIFTTSSSEQEVAATVAKETGTKVEILDPGATQRDRNKDYQDIMRENFQKLSSSLGCK